MESFDNENEFEFSGNVPGTVQGDLIDLELMPHPYIGTNERLFKRLEEKDWTYTRTFFYRKFKSRLALWVSFRRHWYPF